MRNKKLKIYFDDQPLKTGHSVRGIGSYTKNLLEALRGNKEIKFVKNGQEADLVHYPYFNLFFNTLSLPEKPTVVTVFDVIPSIYPEKYPPGIKGKFRFLLQKRKLSKVDAIITISETSRKDIVRLLDIHQEKIYVAHLAPNRQFKKLETGTWKLEITKRFGLPERFVLYVGDVNYNKNVLGLIKAFALVADKKAQQDVGLVLVGKAFRDDIPETQGVLRLIKELRLEERVRVLGFVPDEDLVKIYNLAQVYCQPSFYEGFGLPVLEAMACGAPVAASRTQALVEIAEGAAVFFNPHNPKDIASVLGDILTKPGLQKTLSEKGLSHVKNFSWKKTASQTINVYKKVVNG